MLKVWFLLGLIGGTAPADDFAQFKKAILAYHHTALSSAPEAKALLDWCDEVVIVSFIWREGKVLGVESHPVTKDELGKKLSMRYKPSDQMLLGLYHFAGCLDQEQFIKDPKQPVWRQVLKPKDAALAPAEVVFTQKGKTLKVRSIKIDTGYFERGG